MADSSLQALRFALFDSDHSRPRPHYLGCIDAIAGVAVFKYLGSKRVFVPVLGQIARNSGARTAVDLFTGTTRVAQEFKRLGLETTACDLATYSYVEAQTYIQTDASQIDEGALASAIEYLNSLPGEVGYFTEMFCVRSRFFQPKNGARVDAIRNRIESEFAGSPLYPILLTALIDAADKVDSTTGVQMAYLKEWAPRAYNDLKLEVPTLIPGRGHAMLGDAMQLIDTLPPTDLIYLDPPYNQHRYFTNYHIWETLVRWDAPEVYGIACKRMDARDPETKSVFNSKPRMKNAFFDLLSRARAGLIVISYNNESWISEEEMTAALFDTGVEDVRALTFDHARYVGARIGIHNPQGQKVGTVTHTRNQEWVFVAGDRATVEDACSGLAAES